MKRPRETEEESFSSSQEILQSVEAAADRPTSLAVKLGIASSPRSRTASPALSSTTATDGPAPITITQGYDEHTGRTTSASEAPRSKIIELDLSSDTTDPNSHLDDGNNNIMKCSLPGHKYPVRFSSYEEYETHYTKNHTNQCRECRKNFPSEHLLGLHIEEVHDSFLAVKRDRGDKTYSCFVETCDRKFGEAAKRNRHLIDKHHFPKNYFFLVTTQGIDGRMSMLNEEPRWKKYAQHKPRAQRDSIRKAPTETGEPGATSTTTTTTNPEQAHTNATASPRTVAAPDEDPIDLDPVIQKTAPEREREREHEPIDVEMDDLTGAMSSLRFIPPAIRFGRGRKGFAKH